MKYKRHLLNVERKFNDFIPLDACRLHSSERNLDYSSKIWNKFLKSLTQKDIKYYPNLNKIYSKLKTILKINSVNNIIIGDGSDRIIKYIFECFASPNSEIISTNPSFPMYKIYAELFEVKFKAINYKDLKVNLDKIKKKINNKTSFIILSNPSSPMGDLLDKKKLIDLIVYARSKNVLVVIDEAYIEFSDHKSLINKIKKYHNLIIIRTYSKAFGSAGIRFGFGISSIKIINIIKKFRTMHEINSLSAKWILCLLDNIDEINDYIKKVKLVRSYASTRFRHLGYDVISGDANWIHVNRKEDDIKLSENTNFIIKKSCIVPDDSRKNWLRITIPHSKKILNKLIDSLQ